MPSRNRSFTVKVTRKAGDRLSADRDLEDLAQLDRTPKSIGGESRG